MKKVTKINLRVTSKCHAHLQSLTKTPVKFQKDWDKIVGGLRSQSTHLNDGRTEGRTHGRTDGQTDGRTWATLNALPHSSNGGGIKRNVF